MIRFITRWIFRLVILLIVLGVSLVLLKDILLKSWLENRIRSETGLEARIGTFELALLAPTLTLENFVLYNPAQFGGSPFLIIKEIHVEYDRAALSHRELKITLLRLNLSEIDVVENQKGQTNLQMLQALTQAHSQKQAREQTLDFAGIDTLNLTLGKIRFVSLKTPGPAREIDLGFKNQIQQNIKTAADLNAMILRLVLQKSATLASPGNPVTSNTFQNAK
jgi:hypothetical protein